MEEKKKINKFYVVIFTLAIIFIIIGIFDFKVNAAENVSYITNVYKSVYVFEDGEKNENLSYKELTHTLSSSEPLEIFYFDSHNSPVGNGEQITYSFYAVSTTPFICSGSITENAIEYNINGRTFYAIGYNSITSFGSSLSGYIETSFDGDFSSCQKLNVSYILNDFASYYASNNLDIEIDYSNLPIDDEMPIVENLYFDKIEKKENNGISNIKTITDYIRFDPNPNYQLVIMVCPSVYSTIGDSDFLANFELYEYDSWVHMCTSDVGLKEISCELGQFEIPTNNVNRIISSNYKSYYETICYDLSDVGELVFKPTMGYRLAYVDLNNNVMGPSTYILPNYYDNLNPDSECFSYFVLYSDGTRSSEKVMNLKTWEQETEETLEDVQDTIVEVGNALKDYVVVDNDVDVQEASNWLYSVVNFVKGTPQVVGSVLSFLPQPILYGMYVCIFLGIIACGLAIVRALI